MSVLMLVLIASKVLLPPLLASRSLLRSTAAFVPLGAHTERRSRHWAALLVSVLMLTLPLLMNVSIHLLPVSGGFKLFGRHSPSRLRRAPRLRPLRWPRFTTLAIQLQSLRIECAISDGLCGRIGF